MKLNRLSNVFDFLFFLLKKILKYDNISMKVLESKQVSHELFGDALIKAGKEGEAALQWRIAEELRKKKS